ncbi:FCD domain-containing protein [Mycobacterium tuberculosis]
MSTEPDAVWTDKRASKIARRIEADIVRRGWPIGASLGSESALQQRFCVSRSVLREAVRLVEHHQVARMRRGPNGGLFICEPNAGPATRAVVIYLEYLGTTIGDLLGARLVLEPLAASLAAEHIDEPGIERLRAVLRAEERWRPGLPPPPEQFYRVLAEQSKNPVLQLFIDILMRLTKRYVQKSGTQSAGEAVEAAGQVHNEHSDIVAAVTAGGSAWAKTLSERNGEAVAGLVQQHQAGNHCAVPDGGPGGEPSRAHQVDPGAPRGKLAEVLAATIGDDIAASGWQVGSVLGGGEASDVCKGRVLRAGVGLRQSHASAYMRRGPGGGLVVTNPQPQASIDTIALYLQYRKPSREDLRCVRDAIEIDNVAKVVKRRSEPEVASFLDTLGRPRLDNPTDDVRAAAVEEFRFHVGLARAAGNTMLDLFLLILVELFRRHLSSTEQALPTWSDVVAVGHAHVRILEAIGSGDDSLARCRTRRHLDAAASWWL